MSTEFPTLYSKDAKGTITSWHVRAENDLVIIEHGQLKGRKAKKTVRCKPTNVGRANARDTQAQAIFEAQAAWDKKLRQAYFETIPGAEKFDLLLPMLAHPLVKHAASGDTRRDLKFPCHIQRKYNGLRCIADVGPKGVTLWSRQGTIWETLPHIEQAVAQIGQPGDVFDGEVYCHGVPLQTLNGWIKNQSDPKVAAQRLNLQYHLYDMPRAENQSGIWQERYNRLQHRYMRWTREQGITDSGFMFNWVLDHKMAGPFAVQLAALPLQLAATYCADTESQIAEFSQVSVAEGYEGVIIRQFNWEYYFGKRKEALLKWKNFRDEDFLVIDAASRELITADGTSTTILDKFICSTERGKPFEVVPRGTMGKRAKLWEDREGYMKQWLTVRYLERSVDGIPQGNPVGLGFRLLEDKPLDEEEEGMWT
jgi:hypothetical protein